MKHLLPLLALVAFACGASKEEQMRKAQESSNATIGLTCSEHTAYEAARTTLRSALKYPDSSEIDSMESAMISKHGDTVQVILNAKASNAFGVKSPTMELATFVCKNDSLYWVEALVGDQDLHYSGRPVYMVDAMKWDDAKIKVQDAATKAWMDSLSKGLNPVVIPN